jgi:hypothetical protein
LQTFSQIIQSVIVRLSQVPGTSVQSYSEQRIAAMVQHKFDVLFDLEWWPQFNAWTTTSLDGVAGLPVADFTNVINRPQDIRAIYVDTFPKPLPYLPAHLNPYTITGTRVRYIEFINTPAKVFRVWPATALVDNLHINYRTKPDAFISTDVVPFDAQALILGTTYDYAEDDGAVPGSIEKYKVMFDSRVEQLRLALHEAPIEVYDRSSVINTEWTYA